MSIVQINIDLREIHQVGSGTREWLVSPSLCPALSSHGIVLAGLTDAGPDFRFVRPAPPLSLILVCTGGRGWVLSNGEWIPCEAGTAYLTPSGAFHAYQCDSDSRWELCWLASPDEWLHVGDAPALLTVDPEPLSGAVSGLYREAMEPADPALLASWAFLVSAYARRVVQPAEGDGRLRSLWNSVGNDLAFAWDLPSLSARVGVSSEHLRRLCLSHLGHSPMRQVTALRMRQAMALLASESYTVEAVAHLVGYENPFAFSTAFKRHIGVSPSEYRQKAHGR